MNFCPFFKLFKKPKKTKCLFPSKSEFLYHSQPILTLVSSDREYKYIKYRDGLEILYVLLDDEWIVFDRRKHEDLGWLYLHIFS